MRCWWKARWRAAQGIDHQYFFRGYEDETCTRTQLKLNLFTLGYTLPAADKHLFGANAQPGRRLTERSETKGAGGLPAPIVTKLHEMAESPIGAQKASASILLWSSHRLCNTGLPSKRSGIPLFSLTYQSAAYSSDHCTCAIPYLTRHQPPARVCSC